MKICSVEDCNEISYKSRLGFCGKHYGRYKRNGDPNKTVLKRDHEPFCSVLGCNNPYLSKDLCIKHYLRNKTHGNPYISKVNYEHSGKCKIKGCKREYNCKGYCRFHYLKVYYQSWKDNKDLQLFIASLNVRKRDEYKCKWYECNKSSKLGDTINVHHIFPISEYPELKYKEEYMISYCKFHHAYWHKIRGDKYWKFIDI